MKIVQKWLLAGALACGVAACGEAEIPKVSNDSEEAELEKAENKYEFKKNFNEEEKLILALLCLFQHREKV